MIKLIVGRKYKLKTLNEIVKLDRIYEGPGLNDDMEDIIKIGVVTIQELGNSNNGTMFYTEEDGGEWMWLCHWVDSECIKIELPDELFEI